MHTYGTPASWLAFKVFTTCAKDVEKYEHKSISAILTIFELKTDFLQYIIWVFIQKSKTGKFITASHNLIEYVFF